MTRVMRRGIARRKGFPPRRQRGWLVGAVIAGVVVAAAVAVVALRDGKEPVPTDTARPTVDAGAGSGTGVGDRIPVVSIPTLDGSVFSVPAHKPAVLYFIAGWCASCIPEAQALDRIERDVGEQVAIVTVDTDPTDPLENLQRFIEVVGQPHYSFAQDPDGVIARTLAVTALDTTIVVDADGKILYRDAEPTSETQLRQVLAQAGVQ